MTDVAEDRMPRDTWGACARAWLVAWLLVSALVAVFLVVVLATNAMRFGPAGAPGQPFDASMHAFAATLVLVVALLNSVAFAIALVVALPLQATALRLRRASAGAEALAGVAALTSLSAVLSFIMAYALNQPLVLLVAPSNVLLAGVLVAVYLVHVGILLVARRRMRRRDARAAIAR